MKYNFKLFFSAGLLCTALLYSCSDSGNTTASEEEVSEEVTLSQEDLSGATNLNDFEIKTKERFLELILNADKAPITWEDANGNYVFFRADGSTAGGGADGEASMWEGSWKIDGGKLVIDEGALKGSHKLAYFPDDGSLTIGKVDFIRTEW